MTLTSKTVTELLREFRSTAPTPGGGSAAALAGAVGASLLAMVAGLPTPRADTDADLRRLRDAGERCTALATEL
jgi:formiminotetrahydrofolate cyclodeaminase